MSGVTATRGPRPTRPFRALWGRIRRLPLRVQLVFTLVVLLAAVLIGSYFVASASMQGYLLHQLDTRLGRTTGQVQRALSEGGLLPPNGFNNRFLGGGRGPIQDTDQISIRVGGQTVWSSTTQSAAAASQPALPANPQLGSAFTVPSQGAGDEWRVLATAVPTTTGTGSTAVVLVATDQGEVDAAIGDLSQMYLRIAVGALILLGGLGYALVRSSLRPLEEVEQTAEGIAAGDLSRRVPVRRAGSEVGRLASAFNTMVERIESAFRARERSEASATKRRMRSSELRTPLTSIRGYAELYRQGAVTKTEDIAGVLRRIEEQAARMGLLVDDLLLLARLDQQRPLEHARVNLAVLAVDAVHDVHAVAPDRTVGLRLPPATGDDSAEEPAEVPVSGDEARLRQVLGNLVNNAVLHTPPGTPVEVRVRADGQDAVIEVADKGPGLPPDQAERVFERFYRADPARARVSGGTGLGLAIVAAIVAAHGGRVEVQTTVGAGTTFRVLLPLTPA